MKHSHMENRTHEVEIIEGVSCDLCGKMYEEANELNNTVYWEEAPITGGRNVTTMIEYEVEDTVGHGEGGDIETTYTHICPNCFRTSVIPALKELGVKFHRTKVDW